jgi:hypothetical protein
MGILDNLESAWDEEFQFESKPLIETNSLGQPVTHDKPETHQ